MHLLVSPAASHSGYEDHFQSDLFHYLHHRYFECNYAGSDAAFMDIAFGTFVGSFANHPVDKDGPKPREDAKSSLRQVPSQEFIVYLGGSALCALAWVYTSLQKTPVSGGQALLASCLLGFGPVILSTLVSRAYTSGASGHPVKMSFLANLLHLFFGILFCSIPVTYGAWLAVA